jgi:uncharacterized membrane protein YcaP (DUF421 family)
MGVSAPNFSTAFGDFRRDSRQPELYFAGKLRGAAKLNDDMQEISRFIDEVLGLSAPTANDLSAAQVSVRALIVYGILIAFVRMGKKRFLGQATAFDAILIIMIGSLSSRAVSGTAPFVATLVATFVFILMHWLISFCSERSPALSSLVKGHDTTLIENGRVDRNALKDAHMSTDDLAEDLRQQGVDKVADVKEARLERSGKVSVIKK